MIDNAYNTEHAAGGTAVGGWYNGDFNYDGIIDGSVYSLIDNAFNSQGGSLSPSLVANSTTQIAAVPEPASVATLLLIGVAALSGGRKRSHTKSSAYVVG